MNWHAGMIAFILYFPPMIIVLSLCYRQDKEIDQRYDEEMKRIRNNLE